MGDSALDYYTLSSLFLVSCKQRYDFIMQVFLSLLLIIIVYYYCCLDDTDEIHIGLANQFECSPTFYYTVKKCCMFSSWHPQADPFNRRRYPFAFSVYGEDPKLISVSSEWLVPAKYHYPTDLEFTVMKNSSDPTVWVSLVCQKMLILL